MTTISVIITCYNERAFIADAIESVLSQTVFDQIKEIIIVDDGSTDGSKDIIQSYVKRTGKVTYVYQENQGLAVARNTAIKKCSGNWIALLDGDDTWSDTKLEEQADVAARYPDVGIIYSDFLQKPSMNYVRVNSYSCKDGIVQQNFFINDGPIIPSAALISARCFEEVGLFNPKLRKAQDTEMWLRIMSRFRIHHIKRALVQKLDNPKGLGASYETKIAYMFFVVDHVCELYPYLAPLKKLKMSKLHLGYARYLLRKGLRKQAIQEIKTSLFCKPLCLQTVMTLSFVAFPFVYRWFRPVRQTLRKYLV